MSIESQIHDAVAERTAGPVPEPDLDRIMRRRWRPRAYVVPALAAVAALAVILASGLLTQRVATPPAEPAPPTPVPNLRIVLLGDDRVTIGGETFELEHGSDPELSAATPYGLVYLGDDQVPYLKSPDGTERRLANAKRRAEYGGLVADADGSTVAWAVALGKFAQRTVEVYDLAQRRRVDRIDRGAVLVGVDDGVVVQEVPDGGGSSYVSWLVGDDEWEWLEQNHNAIVGLAGHRIFVRGTGPVRPDTAPGATFEGWTLIRLPEQSGVERSFAPEDQHVSPDGRSQLEGGTPGPSGEPSPIVLTDLTDGARTEVVVGSGRLTEARIGFDSDSSPLVLARVGGRDDWSLFDCPITATGAGAPTCERVASGLEDPSFPGRSGYGSAPFPGEDARY